MSGAKVDVRRAGVDDVARVVNLNALLFREDSGRRDPFINQDWPSEEGREYFAGFLTRGRYVCLLAESAGETVGYLAGYVASGGNLRPIEVAELESMYVLEEYRGFGVGARLVEEFRRWAEARGADRASVTAYAANVGAVRFYEKTGFRPKSLSLEMGLGET